MKRRVIYEEFAANALRKFDEKTAARIMGKVDYIAELEGLPGVLLSGLPERLKGLRRYRVGDYRVLFWVDDEQITVYAVGHRSDVYRALKRL